MAEGHSAPFTPDELLRLDNTVADTEIPADLRSSMSDRRVYVSTAGADSDGELARIGDEITGSGSFRLADDAFLGQLGRHAEIDDEVGSVGEAESTGYRPDWQPPVYHPKIAPIEIRTEPKGPDGTRVQLHKLYPPENRTAFRPEGYPWTCIGRIQVFEAGVPKRLGTATLVGRRTILTSAHMMPRNPGAGWAVLFVPGYFDGQSTAGVSSWCEAYHAVVGPTAVGDSTQDRDLAILKLYQPLGDALGWMGVKTYDDDWEGSGVWTLVGYPGSVTGGERPTFQAGIPVIDDDPSGDWTEVEHRGDATDGNSGGPLFGQWPDGPYLVGVHSGDEYRVVLGVVAEDNNVCAGGVGMPRMVNAKNAEWP
jgi:V8-like Glu-specific endopeptidase